MIREDRFLISRKQFAIDLATITGSQSEHGDRIAFSGSANAVWYRRKDGVTRACIGSLKLFSHYLPERLDLLNDHAVLSADLDGRYGGDCDGRWDGTSYWGNVTLEQQEQHLTLLRPMLTNYPAVPAGFDSWWRF